MKQHTLKAPCSFAGRGLHGGRPATMQVLPAPEGTGVIFVRTDIGPDAQVPARVGNVVRTRRGTTLSCQGVEVRTPEHLLSALSGMGIDNALVRLDAPEVPILDGCALSFAEAFRSVGIVEQQAEREMIEVRSPFTYEDPESGSRMVFEPAAEPSFEVTIDFRSRVVGVQQASFSASGDYLRELAPCRTFCFLREVLPLWAAGLIRGGSLNCSLVVCDPFGFVGGPELRFDNELARHKLLDLIGDLSLAGRSIRGRIAAFKPGHHINTEALKQFLNSL